MERERMLRPESADRSGNKLPLRLRSHYCYVRGYGIFEFGMGDEPDGAELGIGLLVRFFLEESRLREAIDKW
jgi:hypothetical protein